MDFKDVRGYLLAQPVVVGGESPPAVTLIKHHQPPVNAVEQLQLFSLRIFYSTQKSHF